MTLHEILIRASLTGAVVATATFLIGLLVVDERWSNRVMTLGVLLMNMSSAALLITIIWSTWLP